MKNSEDIEILNAISRKVLVFWSYRIVQIYNGAVNVKIRQANRMAGADSDR